MRSRFAVGQMLAFAVPILVASAVVVGLLASPGKAGRPPWGSLSQVSFPADGSRQIPGGSQDIGLKTARISSSPAAPSPQQSPAPAAPTSAIATAAPATTVEAPPPASLTAAPVPLLAAAPAPSPAPVSPTTSIPPATPVRQAALSADPSAADSAASPAPQKPTPGTAIDINTASVDVLDHLPGVGRIGKTVVKHRPYRSVDDLLAKRVLRSSDFQRIRPNITVNKEGAGL